MIEKLCNIPWSFSLFVSINDNGDDIIVPVWPFYPTGMIQYNPTITYCKSSNISRTLVGIKLLTTQM